MTSQRVARHANDRRSLASFSSSLCFCSPSMESSIPLSSGFICLVPSCFCFPSACCFTTQTTLCQPLARCQPELPSRSGHMHTFCSRLRSWFIRFLYIAPLDTALLCHSSSTTAHTTPYTRLRVSREFVVPHAARRLRLLRSLVSFIHIPSHMG
jgi:hypothetical protein